MQIHHTLVKFFLSLYVTLIIVFNTYTMHIFLLYFSGGDVGKKGDEAMREDMEKSQPVLQSTDKDGDIHQCEMER